MTLRTVSALALLLCASVAHAQETFDFTGADFSSESATLSQSTYNAQGQQVQEVTPYNYWSSAPADVQGIVVFAAPLAANLSNAVVTPVGLAFSDGLAGGFDDSDGFAIGGNMAQFGAGANLSITSDSFTVSTNATGQITNYSYSVAASMAGSTAWPTSFTISGNQNGDTVDVSAVWPQSVLTATATSTSGGSWVDPPNAAPELNPSAGFAAVLLLGGVLAVLRGRCGTEGCVR